MKYLLPTAAGLLLAVGLAGCGEASQDIEQPEAAPAKVSADAGQNNAGTIQEAPKPTY